MTERCTCPVTTRDYWPHPDCPVHGSPPESESAERVDDREQVTLYRGVAIEWEKEALEARQLLWDLIEWARAAFDGLEYENESEREELWERLAGGEEPSTLARAERFVGDD